MIPVSNGTRMPSISESDADAVFQKNRSLVLKEMRNKTYGVLRNLTKL